MSEYGREEAIADLNYLYEEIDCGSRFNGLDQHKRLYGYICDFDNTLADAASSFARTLMAQKQTIEALREVAYLAEGLFDNATYDADFDVTRYSDHDVSALIVSLEHAREVGAL